MGHTLRLYLPMTLIPDKERRLEQCGRDMIRLLQILYSHAQPETLDTRGQIPPRPPYPFEESRYDFKPPFTDKHWSEPPLLLSIDWENDLGAVKEYTEQI